MDVAEQVEYMGVLLTLRQYREVQGILNSLETRRDFGDLMDSNGGKCGSRQVWWLRQIEFDALKFKYRATHTRKNSRGRKRANVSKNLRTAYEGGKYGGKVDHGGHDEGRQVSAG